MPETYDYYSFKVDGCLPFCTRAPSERVATERIQSMWPRSTIELMGINLPSAVRTGEGPARAVPTGGSLKQKVAEASAITPEKSWPNSDGVSSSEGDYADAINKELKESA